MSPPRRPRSRSGPPERYPTDPGHAPTGFRGRVEIDFARCTLDGACVEACPTRALRLVDDPERSRAELVLDLGHCIFCGLCEEACTSGAIRLGGEFALATRRRQDLVATGRYHSRSSPEPAPVPHTRERTDRSRPHPILELVARPLRVLHVDAGSCNGCEAELLAATGPDHDLARFGIELVANPHHADLLLVTGPVPPGMARPLAAAYGAMPRPRTVLAFGACAIGGGIYRDAPGQPKGAEGTVPVDLWLPGCPPRPQAILHGFLLARGRARADVREINWRGPYPER